MLYFGPFFELNDPVLSYVKCTKIVEKQRLNFDIRRHHSSRELSPQTDTVVIFFPDCGKCNSFDPIVSCIDALTQFCYNCDDPRKNICFSSLEIVGNPSIFWGAALLIPILVIIIDQDVCKKKMMQKTMIMGSRFSSAPTSPQLQSEVSNYFLLLL